MTRTLCFLLLLIAVPLQGQESAPSDTTILLQGDTLNVAPPGKSPALAMTLSAILPGMGQLYNRSYWKVPVIAGLGGYFIYTFLENNRDYRAYRDLVQAGVAAPAGGDANQLAYYMRLRDFYREQRDSFGWYFLLLYLINIADAYVDASLFSFDVGDDLGGRNPDAVAIPSAMPRVHLRVRF